MTKTNDDEKKRNFLGHICECTAVIGVVIAVFACGAVVVDPFKLVDGNLTEYSPLLSVMATFLALFSKPFNFISLIMHAVAIGLILIMIEAIKHKFDFELLIWVFHAFIPSYISTCIYNNVIKNNKSLFWANNWFLNGVFTVTCQHLISKHTKNSS